MLINEIERNKRLVFIEDPAKESHHPCIWLPDPVVRFYSQQIIRRFPTEEVKQRVNEILRMEEPVEVDAIQKEVKSTIKELEAQEKKFKQPLESFISQPIESKLEVNSTK